MVQKECKQNPPGPALSGAWDEDPNHVKLGMLGWSSASLWAPLLGLSRAGACQGLIETGQKRSYRSTFSTGKTLS